MGSDGKSNPVTCNPSDPSSYGAIWEGALRRDPSKLALFDGRSGMIVAADNPMRFLTPAEGEARRYYETLHARRDRLNGLKRASDVGATVTQK